MGLVKLSSFLLYLFPCFILDLRWPRVMFYLFRQCLPLLSTLAGFKRWLFTTYSIYNVLAVLLLTRVFSKTLSTSSLVANLSNIRVELQFGSIC
jgi:hypothetical protein